MNYEERQKDLFERTSGNGFHIHSRAWFESYKEIAKNHSSTSLMLQRYYLIGHAIELSLKGLVRVSGRAEVDYKFIRKFGHNLQLITEYVEKHLGLKLSRQQRIALMILNSNYEVKSFEYPLRGSMTIVDFKLLEEAFIEIDSRLSADLYTEERSSRWNEAEGRFKPKE